MEIMSRAQNAFGDVSHLSAQGFSLKLNSSILSLSFEDDTLSSVNNSIVYKN